MLCAPVFAAEVSGFRYTSPPQMDFALTRWLGYTPKSITSLQLALTGDERAQLENALYRAIRPDIYINRTEPAREYYFSDGLSVGFAHRERLVSPNAQIPHTSLLMALQDVVSSLHVNSKRSADDLLTRAQRFVAPLIQPFEHRNERKSRFLRDLPTVA